MLTAGFTLFTDSNRIIISRLIGASSETLSNLQQPFFYYIALGLATAGLIAIFASLIGWWAVCLSSYLVLSIVCNCFLFEFILYFMMYLFQIYFQYLVFSSSIIVIISWVFILLDGSRMATMHWSKLGWVANGKSASVQLRSAGKRAGNQFYFSKFMEFIVYKIL